MAGIRNQAVLESPQGRGIPVLENGDSLDAREFLRRFEALPHVKKAELVEGIVFMGSPVSSFHGQTDNLVQTWLGTYAASTPGVQCCTNTTVRLDSDNVFQPDALLRIATERGQSKIDTAGYILGAPELVVEIASSSVSMDLHDKFAVYRRTGVREYLVWRTSDRSFDWFELAENDYRPKIANEKGVIRSQFLPGLWLQVKALLACDAAEVLRTLNEGLSSEEHKSFAP